MSPLSETAIQDDLLVPTGPYCNLSELIRLRFGARDLKLSRQKKTFSQLVGPHQTKFRGRGVEFEEVRAYEAGDDIRNIDWRVTARTGKPHTKLYREERERPVLVLVDQSLSMFFGSKNCFKSVMAAHIAALLAWAAFQHNDRIGGVVFGGGLHASIKAKRNTKSVLTLLNMITEFNHRLKRRPPSKEIDINNALRELRRIIKPGSNIFIISDFQGFSEQGEENLFLLARHNDISSIFVFDHLEKFLPPAGFYPVTDGSKQTTIFTGDISERNRYEKRFNEAEGTLRRQMGNHGIPLLTLSTEIAPLNYFRKLLGTR